MAFNQRDRNLNHNIRRSYGCICGVDQGIVQALTEEESFTFENKTPLLWNKKNIYGLVCITLFFLWKKAFHDLYTFNIACIFTTVMTFRRGSEGVIFMREDRV